MEDNKKNIVWINTMKALCIISVFFVHCQIYYGTWFGEVNQFVHTFYVNGFFFVSGYLLYWKQLSSPRIEEDMLMYISKNGGGYVQFGNIIWRIVVPSILFAAIEFVPSCLIQGRDINLSFALTKTIGGGTYWFTSALVVGELIMLALFCTRNKNTWFYAILCIAISILGWVIVRLDVTLTNLWAWRNGLLSLFFLALGGLYWKYEKQIDNLKHWWFVVPVLVIYVVIILGFKDYNNPLISTREIQPLGFITGTISCLLVVWLCKTLSELKPLIFIGQNSLGFYFLSGAIPISLGMLTRKGVVATGVQLSPEWNNMVMIVLWFLCLALTYLVVIIINKWLPWLWDLRRLRHSERTN